MSARSSGPLWPALAVVIGLLLLGAAPAQQDQPVPDAVSGVRVTEIPEPARRLLPLIADVIAQQCPQLPPVWVIAQVQAESGWDAQLAGSEPGNPAGLYQFGRASWAAAGGAPWPSDPPAPDAEVLSPESHLRTAIPWICANLQAVTTHLQQTGKTTPPLEAMLVCHIAGCGRVTGSATGIPEPGEASCGARCAEVIDRYLATVRAGVERYQAPAAPPPTTPDPTTEPAPPPPAAPEPEPPPPAGGAGAGPPAPWTGGATPCRPPDPTGADGCLTGAARHGLDVIAATFGGWSDGSVIRSAGCWDAHAWNPRSDHSKGRACDLFPGAPGAFAEGTAKDAGWAVAEYLRAHAEPLRVKYLIWQGRYWSPRTADDGGWGRRYSGAGVYDVRNATGGHFDHVHVSFLE